MKYRILTVILLALSLASITKAGDSTLRIMFLADDKGNCRKLIAWKQFGNSIDSARDLSSNSYSKILTLDQLNTGPKR
jgi:hypothetical protein